jgi:hypothetical protein
VDFLAVWRVLMLNLPFAERARMARLKLFGVSGMQTVGHQTAGRMKPFYELWWNILVLTPLSVEI